MPACNRQFGASGGVVSWDTSQDFGSLPPVRALPIPPPDAKLLKRCRQCRETVQKTICKVVQAMSDDNVVVQFVKYTADSLPINNEEHSAKF